MIFHITKLSSYAAGILQGTSEGTVHSVYRSTVNILVNDHLFAIQAAHSPLSPISLLTKLTTKIDKLSLKPGDLVSFTYEKAKIFDLNPKTQMGHSERHELYRKMTKVISNSETGGFELIFQISPKVDQDFILSAAETKIHEAHKYCNLTQYPKAAEKLAELIGLGIGLTPSGDDFLCGILAGLYIQGKEFSEFSYALRNSIQKNLYRTNDISRAFLSCALEGQFSQAVNHLWSNPSAEEISELFHAIGHSSGMDTLCGIYFLFFLRE